MVERIVLVKHKQRQIAARLRVVPTDSRTKQSRSFRKTGKPDTEEVDLALPGFIAKTKTVRAHEDECVFVLGYN